MLRPVTVDALDESLFSIRSEGALREGVVVWSIDDVDVDVAICKGICELVHLVAPKIWEY